MKECKICHSMAMNQDPEGEYCDVCYHMMRSVKLQGRIDSTLTMIEFMIHDHGSVKTKANLRRISDNLKGKPYEPKK